MREINLIVVHCAATPEGKDFTVQDIDRWHKDRGWKGIGYHWVIYRDGSIHAGRPESEIGAHVEGYNAHSIGICYIGGCAATKNAKGKYPSKDTRTPEQKAAMRQLVDKLLQKYPGSRVCGHRDLYGDTNHDGKITQSDWLKSCPCFDVGAEFS